MVNEHGATYPIVVPSYYCTDLLRCVWGARYPEDVKDEDLCGLDTRRQDFDAKQSMVC